MAIDIVNSFLEPTILSSFAFLVMTLFLVYHASKKANVGPRFFQATTAILLIWFSAVFVLSQMEFFAINPLFAPNIVFGWLLIFAFLNKAYNSQIIKKIADAMSMHWAIATQTYRIVGVGFLFLYAQGRLPAIFAFPSGFGDIIVGTLAPFVAAVYFYKKVYARKLAIWWNKIGILDLVIALSVGFLAFPRPVHFIPVYPTTEPMSLFPLAIITLFAVPLALFLHFCCLRVLKKP